MEFDSTHIPVVIALGFVNDPYFAQEDSEVATLLVRVVQGELGTNLMVRLTTEDIGQAIGKWLRS